MRIAVSGHRGLPPGTAELLAGALRRELAGYTEPLVGLSCLADGADQIFARAVLDAGGELAVIVAASTYRAGLPADAQAGYDALLALAGQVIRLDRVETDAEAYMAASTEMLHRADRLVAVWDGEPARGHGGTADVVALAHRLGLAVEVVWPPGAQRD